MSQYLVFTDDGNFLVKAKDKGAALSAISLELGYNECAEGEMLFNQLYDLSELKMNTWENGQVKRLKLGD